MTKSRRRSTAARRPAKGSRRRHGATPNHKSTGGAVSTRTKAVWGSLAAAMAIVGGLLLLMEGRPAPRLDGLTLEPLASARSTTSVEAVLSTRAPLDAGRWKAIVIHASGSPAGSAASIAAEHQARGFRGLGHHFIIGNGSGMADGELHVGYRWLDQLPGAHAGGPKGDWYNRQAISICLVGDGTRQGFSKAQIARLEQLVSLLADRLDIPRDEIKLHSDIASISDPGRRFPADDFRRFVALLP